MASRGINKVIIVGNVGQDPEVKYMPSGSAVANLTIATSESWKDKATGEQKEKTEWHRVAIFGKLAEIAGEYVRKGSQLYIEGKLQTRKWQDQNGQDKYTTEIVLQGYDGVMQMLGSKSMNESEQRKNWGQPNQPQQPQQQPKQQAPQQRAPQQGQPQYNEPPASYDQDIPF